MNWADFQLYNYDYSWTLGLYFLVPFLSVLAFTFVFIILPIVTLKFILRILAKIIRTAFKAFSKKKIEPSESLKPNSSILNQSQIGQAGYSSPLTSHIPPVSAIQEPYFWDTGKTGERYICEVLKFLSGYKQILSNCYVPKDDGTFTEIDVILLHESGVYVLESKNYSGRISGSEDLREWIQFLPTSNGGSKKVTFLNPIIQNNVHVKWLRNYLDVGADFPLYSYIVFSDRCELERSILLSNNYIVINRRVLPLRIRRNAEKVGSRLSPAEIDSLYSKLYPLTQVTEEQKALHIKTVEEKKKSLPKIASPTRAVTRSDRKCPRCGGTLVLRTAKKGARVGKNFWGCSNYPQCRFIENIDSSPE